MRRASYIVIPLLAVLCLFPFITAAMALLLGIAAALIFGNPYHDKMAIVTRKLLACCVVGLGAGMNLIEVTHAGVRGLGYTAASIVLVLLAGAGLARLLRAERETSFLITVGTAICGGSAIAAIAPVMNARSASISVAMGVVFALNAIALLIFPAIGQMFALSQDAFGLWSALAIHDTSSVVGAGLHYGPRALEVGTTVKLARALWIVPLVIALSVYLQHRQDAPDVQNQQRAKRRYPWFILGFVAMAAVVTWVPALAATGQLVAHVARQGLVVCLFLIGASLTRETVRAVGLRPLAHGVLLWLFATAGSLAAIKYGVIGL